MTTTLPANPFHPFPAPELSPPVQEQPAPSRYVPPLHVDPRDVASIIAATFPAYRGRKVQVSACAVATLSNLNWDDGSRHQYRGCSLDGSASYGAADNRSAPWENPHEGAKVQIPAGAALVCLVDFRATQSVIIYCNPADMPRLLPASAEFDPAERAFLVAAVSFKSSYNGKDRYQMAREDASYGRGFAGLDKATFPTRDAWDAAKVRLIARGFLNKAGAITLAGRNACPR